MSAPPAPFPAAPSVARRARPYLLILACAAAALWLRAAHLQVVRYPFFRDHARRQETGAVPVPAARGTIYTRDGLQVAWNLWVDSVYAVPTLIDDPRATAARLAEMLGVPAEPLALRIERSKSRDRLFVWIARWVDPARADRLRKAGLAGIGLRKEPRRQYPWGDEGAALLGFVGVDGKGLLGLERRYEPRLAGRDGLCRIERDARGRILMTDPADAEDLPADGRDLYLSLDSRLQAVAEQEIGAAAAKHRPARAVAILMETETGAIRAMAARPTFDPNDFRSADPRSFAHPAVSLVYEPGSTFKPFVLAAALAEGTSSLAEKVFCHNGEWRIGSRILHDHHPYGWLTAEDVVVHSSNIGIARIGMGLSPERLHAALAGFGIGRRTGIELSGEEAGIFHPVRRWSRESVRSIPMGHEIALTPIQLLAAFNVFAAGGRWVAPRLIESTPVRAVPVLSEGVAAQVRRALEGVVERGTGKAAQCEYALAGKTGTSRKIGPDGRYRSDRHIASFLCYGPADAPRYTCLVVVDEPKGGEYYGGAVAAPIAREILRRALASDGVPPSARPARNEGRIRERTAQHGARRRER